RGPTGSRRCGPPASRSPPTAPAPPRAVRRASGRIRRSRPPCATRCGSGPSFPPRPRPTPRVRHPPNPLRGSRASVLQDSWARCTARVSERERPVPPISALGGATSYGTLCRSLTRRDSPQRILRAGWVWNGPHPRELGDAVTTPGSYRGLGGHLGAPHLTRSRDPDAAAEGADRARRAAWREWRAHVLAEG